MGCAGCAERSQLAQREERDLFARLGGIVAPEDQLAQEAPLVAHPTQPIKPLRVWSAKTSWYGGKFQGRTTANGEKYDMYASTGASPNLPFGSLIRVSNPKNHTAQLVRINDRGPFADDRDLDVSYLVATRLGLQERGVARLRVELLEVPKRP